MLSSEMRNILQSVAGPKIAFLKCVVKVRWHGSREVRPSGFENKKEDKQGVDLEGDDPLEGDSLLGEEEEVTAEEETERGGTEQRDTAAAHRRDQAWAQIRVQRVHEDAMNVSDLLIQG
ncbi:hypothetical protein scyTo_0012654 [Scyliorhinus torazame]|uniref:Uncharacterized protein n=1 Tax=Scyliorhinus torazame TaxID=75743 RepID=A0A401NGF1_SCYTO|nr:hypothetical protein [Scyliorhinus torazame]